MAELNVNDVNFDDKNIALAISEAESEYFKKLSMIADGILAKDDVNIVLIAGPSGKVQLGIQLQNPPEPLIYKGFGG